MSYEQLQHMHAQHCSSPYSCIRTAHRFTKTQASRLGLLSKLEQAGLTLRDVEKLLPVLDELDAIGITQALSKDLMPLAPTALAAAPALLPLAAGALGIPPGLLYGAAAASLAAGAAAIALIPDDSVGSIALQAFLAVPLLVVLPGAAVVGANVLTKATDGSLVPFLAGVAGGLQAKAAPAAAAVQKKAGESLLVLLLHI
jgi:Protein of unknown function (DUF1118)